MTDNLTGRLASVATLPLVGFLASDAPIGTTVLDLEEASDFDADGGVVLLSGGDPLVPAVSELVAYDTADDDTATLTLSAPTTVAFFAGDRVELWDNAEGAAVVETVAQVVLPGDAGNVDPVEATVDHALIPYLVEGIRAPGAEEAVALEWRGRSLFVVDVLGRIPVMDGGMIDPDTLPPSGGPEPSTPVIPAAPTVYGGVGMLIVRWEGITHPNPVEYELHVSEVSGFLPGPTTLIGVVTGTQMTVRRLPMPTIDPPSPDSPLLYDTPYFAAIIARDSVDPSYVSGKSAEGEGMAIQVTGADLAVNSVAAENIIAGSVNGESFAGELFLGSRITTAESGQRVEMDTEGFRLYNSLEELRVNLPTDPSQDPSFRGRVEADGLTVREGATFYSPQNEFAQGAVINLAEQVGAPVASPSADVYWDSVGLSKTARTGSLGTFALDASQIQSVHWDAGGGWLNIVQKRSNGSRVWLFALNGGSSATVWDHPNFDISSIASGSGDRAFLFQQAGDSRWWIADYNISGEVKRYIPLNPSGRPYLFMTGADMYVAETVSNNIVIRKISTASDPVNIISTVTTTGAPGASPNPAFAYRGTADWSADRFLVGYKGSGAYRAFSSTGVYADTWNFDPPVSKAGAFWHPGTSRFYTVGTDGRLYTHSNLTWTTSTNDTWHVAQDFFTHGSGLQTTVGGVRTFTMKKRARVRFTMADVPYSGEAGDPNAWTLYGKRGAAPVADRSDMREMTTGWYYNLVYTTDAAPPLTADSPLLFGTYPGGTPALMQTQRTLPSDSTKSVFQIRGDGAGRWGPFEFTADGKVGGVGVAAGWQTLPLINGAVAEAGHTPQYMVVGPVVYLRGRLTNPAAASMTIGQLPFTWSRIMEVGNVSQVPFSQPPARVGVTASGQVFFQGITTSVTQRVIAGVIPLEI